MPHAPESLKNVLTSYLEGLKSNGVREIEWQGTPPGERSAATLPETPPPPKPTPPPPLEKAAPTPTLPAAPTPERIVEKTAAVPQWIRAVRHPDCSDPDWPRDGWILVVSAKDEFSGEAGHLMNEMLLAIGFVAENEAQDLQKAFPEGCVRVLVMGEEALQAVSTAGMKLQLVRGLWQKTDAGRMLATYAPSAVLDSPSGKKTVWTDLQILASDLGLELPEWTRKKLKKKT